MIRNSATLKDIFGDYYHLVHSIRKTHHANASSLMFHDNLSAKQFLLRFNRDSSQWQLLAKEIGVTKDPYASIATALVRGRVKAFKISAPNNDKNESKKSLTSTKSHNVFQILSANDVIAEASAKAKTFANRADAKTFLDSLDLDEKQIQSHLDNLLTSGPSARSSGSSKGLLAHELTHSIQSNSAKISPIDALSQEVASGNLIVLDRGPKRGPTDPSGTELPEPTPIPVVPLAPESESTTTDFLEIELVDEEGNPVADQKYWIKDAEGNEYEGMTDSSGKARLDDIPKGSCDISFPEADSWN